MAPAVARGWVTHFSLALSFFLSPPIIHRRYGCRRGEEGEGRDDSICAMWHNPVPDLHPRCNYTGTDQTMCQTVFGEPSWTDITFCSKFSYEGLAAGPFVNMARA